MYRQKGGQLLWKYIKPLFVGKILYTPNNAVNREIVSEANSTFNNMARLLNTVKSTLATQKTLTQEVENLENLQVGNILLTFLGSRQTSFAILPVDYLLLTIIYTYAFRNKRSWKY